VTPTRVVLEYFHPWTNAAGLYVASAEGWYREAGLDVEMLERVLAYFPRAHLARSLRLITPTWFHDDRWGESRAELVQPYAAWLAEHGILRDAGVWAGATTTAFLPVATA
jgi:NitT/TauT family transport system substrate-binding protein